MSAEFDRIVVKVSRHAFAQARGRLGEIDVTDIVRDVRLALLQGRSSSERPTWLGPGPGAHRGALFTWNAAETRAYLIRADDPRRPRRFAVITTLTRRASPIAEAFARAQKQTAA